MVRTQDKIGLVIGIACFTAAMLVDVFGHRATEDRRAACVARARSPQEAWANAAPVDPDPRCVDPVGDVPR